MQRLAIVVEHHVGGGAGRFGCGFQQTRHGRFQGRAQRGQVGGQGGLQLTQALHSGLAPRAFFAAQRGELGAPPKPEREPENMSAEAEAEAPAEVEAEALAEPEAPAEVEAPAEPEAPAEVEAPAEAEAPESPEQV